LGGWSRARILISDACVELIYTRTGVDVWFADHGVYYDGHELLFLAFGLGHKLLHSGDTVLAFNMIHVCNGSGVLASSFHRRPVVI
jgi:hypothetical protein